MPSETDEILGHGALRAMQCTLATPIEYTLLLGESSIPLNNLLGRQLRIRFEGTIDCRHCKNATRKSYGGGYCYPCFKTLARCDLCVVSPVRCHYAAGTCREPGWGEAYCMQPHIVYVANSAGAKVGITKQSNLPGRWLDQGATQAMVIMHTQSRYQAGCVEAEFARHVSDRTDWRALINRDAAELDLRALAQRLRHAGAAELTALAARFAGALSWVDDPIPVSFLYPVIRHTSVLRGLSLAKQNEVGGELLGIKGQYLLFDTGAFNVARHTSYHVEAAVAAAPMVHGRDQLEMF